MGIRPEFRWWILTVLVVGVLLLISALALDRPNVVWEQGQSKCPHCRVEVEPYSTRCKTCSELYDWLPTADDQGAIRHYSLGALEAHRLRARVEALGDAESVRRTMRALGLSETSAQRYLEHIGRGRCGFCGGTGRDLEADTETATCPVCFGRGTCIGSGPQRRARLGDERAHRDLIAYREGVEDLVGARAVPDAVQREEVRRLTEVFVRKHAGSVEAAHVLFWPAWPVSRPAVKLAMERLDLLVEALETER